MKTKALFLALVLLLAFPLIGVTATAPTGGAATGAGAPGSVLGWGRELGLLVAGIGWEAVRIVLPESCPAKHKDIDQLIHNDTNPANTTSSPNKVQ